MNLLDRALGLDQQSEPWPLSGRVVLIEDRVETSGSFVLHLLIKRALSSNSSNVIIFVAFANPFSHYDRILRKLVRKSDGDEGKVGEGGLVSLYDKILKTLYGLPGDKSNITIMLDDISLMEVAANGASDYVLDFLHYCHALTSEFDCSLVILNHEDIYSSMERPTFVFQMEYLADILIKAEPLSTGLATDVHGQLTVLNKGASHRLRPAGYCIQNFHFRVKENSVEYFNPGSLV